MKKTKFKHTALIGQLITTCMDDELFNGIVTEHIKGNLYKVFANCQPLYATYNTQFNLWCLASPNNV